MIGDRRHHVDDLPEADASADQEHPQRSTADLRRDSATHLLDATISLLEATRTMIVAAEDYLRERQLRLEKPASGAAARRPGRDEQVRWQHIDLIE